MLLQTEMDRGVAGISLSVFMRTVCSLARGLRFAGWVDVIPRRVHRYVKFHSIREEMFPLGGRAVCIAALGGCSEFRVKGGGQWSTVGGGGAWMYEARTSPLTLRTVEITNGE